MKNTDVLIKSIVLSAIMAVGIVVLLTIYAELNPILKNWLASKFYHHWIGKGALSLVGFIVSALIFYSMGLKKVSLPLLIWLLVIFTNASIGLIGLFFLVETFFLK